MKPIISKKAVKQGLSAHAAIGLLASALLYLVCVSGTLVVFYQEWQRIEQPGAPEMTRMAPDALQSAVERVLAAEPAGKPTSHLFVQLPEPALPRTAMTTDTDAVNIAADGSVAGPQERSWADFLLAIHYTLHLPATWGLIVVGALGVVMVALAITGVIAHPRIFRDAFRLRARSGSGIGLADWHNRLSVWTLPFSLAIALTGAVIGLSSLTNIGLARQFYDGDLLAAYAPVFGDEGAPDKTAAAAPDIAAPMRYMARHFPQADPYFVVVHDPLTKGQHVQILARHAHRLIYGETYNFDARGRFLGAAGMSDGALGKQAAASNYNLHFGNFGGLPVKIAYFAFGAALCAIVGTGPAIWLGKRRRRGLHEPRMRAAWNAVLWGVPAMMLVVFVARMAIGDAAPLAAIFWVGTALAVIAAIVKAGLRERLAQRAVPATPA